MTPAAISNLVTGAGFGLGFAFGLVAAGTNYCTMGALSDVVNMGHWGRVRMWLLAVAVAMLGTGWLSYSGQIDLAHSVTQRPNLPWLSLLVGGLCFGVGMTLAGGCVNKNLIRLGGGSLRSLVVLTFLAIAAYMTLKGLFGQWRASLLDPVRIDLAALGWPDQSLATALSRASGLARNVVLPVATVVVALALFVFAFKDARFRANRAQVLGGIALGALVVAGWYVSGHLGYGENPETLETVYFGTNTHTIESLSFVAPAGYSLELLMLWTDASLHLSFGIASAIGVVLGSATHALWSRQFRLEGFASIEDLRNQMLGAVLMGFGGITGLGCTIGQGMSGLSTLAIGSFIAVAGIVGGCVATLRHTLWREERAG